MQDIVAHGDPYHIYIGDDIPVGSSNVGEIRRIGMDVIPDPSTSNPFHVFSVPLNNPMKTEEAELLSSLFKLIDNIWR